MDNKKTVKTDRKVEKWIKLVWSINGSGKKELQIKK